VDGREGRIGNPGSGRGGRGGRWLALGVGVFGTLVMHSPKVPHPDFSVQVVRHNLKIFCCGKLLRGEALGYVPFIPCSAQESGMRVRKIF
jgi:hypothetical protein